MVRDVEFTVFRKKKKAHSCVVCLAGRGCCGGQFARQYYNNSELDNTTFVGVTPYSFKSIEWYPQPFSSTNQSAAVAGLKKADLFIKEIVKTISNRYEVPYKKIALVGFSAGAVMALYSATRMNEDLAGVVVHAGAALEPHKIPQKKNKTNILLTHGGKDFCFDWYERYVPMKNALIRKGYEFHVAEDPKGTHIITYEDVVAGSQFLAPHLGYEEFTHSDYYKIPISIKPAEYEKSWWRFS